MAGETYTGYSTYVEYDRDGEIAAAIRAKKKAIVEEIEKRNRVLSNIFWTWAELSKD